MSLKICKDCGKEISKTANICPNCGRKQSISCGMIVVIIFIIVPIIGIAIVVAINDLKPVDNFNYNTFDLRMKAALYSQQYLKEITSKQKITFDEIDGSTATYKNDSKYLVASNYYLLNLKGRKLKYYYVMLISYNHINNSWSEIDLKSIPQH